MMPACVRSKKCAASIGIRTTSWLAVSKTSLTMLGLMLHTWFSELVLLGRLKNFGVRSEPPSSGWYSK